MDHLRNPPESEFPGVSVSKLPQVSSVKLKQLILLIQYPIVTRMVRHI